MNRSGNDSRDQLDYLRAWKLLATESWLAFDAETTGRGADAEVVELAVVDEGGTILFDALVRPTGPVRPGAAKLHGLTEERLASESSFAEHYDALSDLLADRILVAYNARFDRRVVGTTCALSRNPVIPATWLCALDLYESLRGFRPPLHVACEIEGVENPQSHHRALADAVALHALVVKLKDAVEEGSLL